MFVGAADDERKPELGHVDRGPVDAREIEELRAAVRAVIVVHGHFDNDESRVLDLLHHLEADHAAVLFQPHLVENRPAHHAEITVDVAHLQSEQHLDDVVVQASDENAVPRIRSAELVAVHQIHAGAHLLPEQLHLAWIVLSIAIGVEDDFFRRRRKSAAQGPAVSAIGGMRHDAERGIDLRQRIQNLRRRVGAAVVDDNHLVVRRQPRGGLKRTNHKAGNRAAVVVRREKNTETRRGGRRAAGHVRGC